MSSIFISILHFVLPVRPEADTGSHEAPHCMPAYMCGVLRNQAGTNFLFNAGWSDLANRCGNYTTRE